MNSEIEQKQKKLSTLLKMHNIQPKKYHYGSKTVVVMPSPIQKKDFTDYTYAKDIDEKVLRLASSMAEKLAVSMVRETLSLNLDGLVDKICDKIIEKIPEITVKETIHHEKQSIRKDMENFTFDRPNVVVDRSDDIQLHGDLGKTTKTKDSTDEALDALSNLL
jgi:predicted transcriptional regulator